MSLYEDFCEPLVQEVLTDVADRFFGVRKELEDMLNVFHAYAEKLREKEADVAAKAGFLHYLFFDKESALNFYKSINIDPPDIFLDSPVSNQSTLSTIPFAFTNRGKFTNLVLWAYSELEHACNEYLNGKSEEEFTEANRNQIMIHYRMLENMCNLINEKVYKVNHDSSPVCVLQYAKRFDSQADIEEQIGGPSFGGYACSIDKKLAFKPIQFDSLGLKKYPELPKREEKTHEINAFCKKFYCRHSQKIQALLSNITMSLKKGSEK